ncbi:MAG: DUF4376 domain-containing protein [Candidatus Peribacteraceae bacterium]|nr:DUF4376 domain-containing protein [Candidatus Peribacteraceae bacterium]
MRYARVVDDKVHSVYNGSLGWMDDKGVPLTDDVYVMDHGIYPVTEPHISDDRYMEQDMEQWVINDNGVTITYYLIVDDEIQGQNDIGVKITKLPKTEWVYNIVEQTVDVQYDVSIRTDEEISRVVAGHIAPEPDKDYDLYLEKPQREWLFDGLNVYKTYYTIVPDPNREQHSEVFYDVKRGSRRDWLNDGNLTFEKCIFTPKTDLPRVKSNLKNYIADHRWRVETGGVFFMDKTISTDRDSQSKILSKYTLIRDNGSVDDIFWKTVNGFVRITPEEFTDMAVFVDKFVNSTYKRESLLYNDIEITDTFNGLKDIFDKVETFLVVDDSVFVLGNEGD